MEDGGIETAMMMMMSTRYAKKIIEPVTHVIRNITAMPGVTGQRAPEAARQIPRVDCAQTVRLHVQPIIECDIVLFCVIIWGQ
jgi:hypothetical protein